MVNSIPSVQRTALLRYGAALLAVAAATGFRFALNPYVGNRIPLAVFYFAVIPVAWNFGVGPSLWAITLATLSATVFFIPPFNEFGITMVTDLIGIALFVVVNLIIVWFAEANQIARRRLEAEVQERVRAETTILAQIHRIEFGGDIGLALTSEPTLAAVLDRCAGLTLQHLGGDHAWIDTLDHPDREGHATDDPERSDPPDPHGLTGLIPDGWGRDLIGRIAAERRPYLTNTLVTDVSLADREWVGHAGMAALAGCPLVVEDRLVGVWVLCARTSLSDSTLAAMESVASSLAVGIERKRAEESRRIGEAREAGIMRSALDGIITMDHRGRVVEFNPAAERIFGCSAATIQGRQLADVVMPQRLRSAHRQGLDHYLKTGEGPILNRRIEVPALRADGTEFPAELTVTRIPMAGPPLFTAHIRDLSDRKEAEQALRSAKRDAEEANQAKDRFIAVLSHELRTPLNPICLMVNSLLGKTAKDHQLHQDLELIQHYVGLEARLIDDLLDVMRIARGALPLRWEEINAHALVDQAVAACDDDLRARSLRLTLDLSAQHPTIQADPSRVCQVFWNLIKNAVKFTPSGGAIAIRSRNEPSAPDGFGPESDAAGEVLVIEVADTGVGIEPGVLPTIFDAFQQGDSPVVRRSGGLGLGLAISKGVVEGHGGRIDARSDGLDRGTTFTVRLRSVSPRPVAPTEPTGPAAREFAFLSPRPDPIPFARVNHAPDRGPGPTQAPLQVLVVEDEPATIRLMSRLLKRLGYHVTAAETVAEAAQHVDGSPRFDLIVSDIGLPDGTGLDLMRRVRATRGELPGIALTGFGTDADIEQSRLAGFSAHMTKPIDFNQLEALIRLVVSTS